MQGSKVDTTTLSNTQAKSLDLLSIYPTEDRGKNWLGISNNPLYFKSHYTNLTTPKIVIIFPLDSWREHKQCGDTPDVVFSNTDQLSKRTLALLAPNSLNRFDEFKTYAEGWDSRQGLPLASRSIAVLEYFINHLTAFVTLPSLFLTWNGNLQIGWENSEGKLVEVEFFGDRIEFYVESTEEEGQIGLNEHNIAWLISLLREHDYCE